jgi:hypothetical protein
MMAQERNMTRRTWLAIIASSAAILALPTLSIARENHVAQAITHTRAAVGEGLDGKAGALVNHANEALEHANAAQQEQSNRHVRAGIVHLKESIKHGKRGHASVATRHAKTALSHLQQAPH